MDTDQHLKDGKLVAYCLVYHLLLKCVQSTLNKRQYDCMFGPNDEKNVDLFKEEGLESHDQEQLQTTARR